jgi:dTDP-4-dehydrorhamnose 3,5-epimerase
VDQLTKSGILGFKVGKFSDERGQILKAEFALDAVFKPSQMLHVTNRYSNTLRGLHFQEAPFAERKVIICLKGNIFDVLINRTTVLDLNPEVFEISLGQEFDYQGLLIPANFAHGYVTLSDDVELNYLMDLPFNSSKSDGYLWSDPKLKIRWPVTPKHISSRDQNWDLL